MMLVFRENDICKEKDFSLKGLLKTQLVQDSVQYGAICKEPTTYAKEILYALLYTFAKGVKSAETLSRIVTLLIFVGFLHFAGDSGQHWWNLTLTC